MLRQPSTLWAIEGLPDAGDEHDNDFAAALQQHLDLSGHALTTTVMQIGTQQRSYVRLYGCGSCQFGRCTPGCRVRLFERVLKSGWGSAVSLRHVERGKDKGLVQRPYTRVYIGTPRHNAQPLDGSLLHPWREARLTLTWARGAMPAPEQKPMLCHLPALFGRRMEVGAILVLGDGGPDDPQVIFGERNWNFIRASKAEAALLRLYGGRTVRPPRVRLGVPQGLAPHLLVAASRDSEKDPLPDLPEPAPLPSEEEVIAHGHATTIARELQEMGVRVEFLDLYPDSWTVKLAAIHPSGMEQFLTDLHADHSALFVKDGPTFTVSLRNTATMAPGMLPPVLKLGTLRDNLNRYRPISRTHHLIVSGPELPGVLAGLVAPLVDGRSDVRLGILDVADGSIARELSGVPRRLPTARADDEQELLGVLGSISALGVPVMVIVYAADPERCHKAVIPLMRASAYLNLSLVMATPTEDNLPELIRQRVPILRIVDRQAHWASPYGMYYEWGRKTPLRLPYRDPGASWALPDAATLPTLVSTDEYWHTPDHLTETLIPGDAPQRAEAAANERKPGDEEAGKDSDDLSREGSDSPDTPAESADTASAAPAIEKNPGPRNPIRLDEQRNVVVDDELIGHVLNAITYRHNEATVSIKQLQKLFALEKPVAVQILAALKDRQIITGEPRQGHYAYESVSEAIANNHVPDGPWTTPPAPTGEALASSDASDASDAGNTEQEAQNPLAAAPPVGTANDPLVPETEQQSEPTPPAASSRRLAVSGTGLWHVTGIDVGAIVPMAEFGFDRDDVLAPDIEGSNDFISVDDVDAGQAPEAEEVSQ